MNYNELISTIESSESINEIDYNIEQAIDVYETETEISIVNSVPEVQIDLFELKA